MATEHEGNDGRVEQLLDTPDLASALESDRFKQFLDHIPIAIAVSELRPVECIVYANFEFERLTGQTAGEIHGKPWSAIVGEASAADDERQLSDAIADEQEYIGVFSIQNAGQTVKIDAWSNIIEDDDGAAVFRLIALADADRRGVAESAELERSLRDKDTLLRELQHRVRNNLQMITALIRFEARNMPDDATVKGFDRLAGRVESLALLYRALSEEGASENIDLGVYLSEIATAVMRAHAVEGIHLDLQVDTWPVSINVAMPAGLVVNELLTNSLKHAFVGRDGGTISMHSLVDEGGCRLLVADDGVGLEEGTSWPQAGKLGAMIVQSLRRNAKARFEVESHPGEGVRVTIFFARADAVDDPDHGGRAQT
jgi:PAS domain S-box-containing protein